MFPCYVPCLINTNTCKGCVPCVDLLGRLMISTYNGCYLVKDYMIDQRYAPSYIEICVNGLIDGTTPDDFTWKMLPTKRP